MPSHNFSLPRGQVVHLTIASEALRGNLLGDPAERVVSLYLPEGYTGSDGDYPLFVGLAGFTGSGLKMLAWRSFGESVPQRLDRLVGQGKMGPVIAAFPDGFTSLGGNQYIDSPVFGNWERFLLEEMVPRIESHYRVRRGAAHRAVFGRSSGGYGALVQGLRHGAHWGAVACHSGDINFELAYGRDWPRALDQLARREGGIGEFLEHLETADRIGGEEMHTLMLLAMAATYDPDPGAPWGIRLPVDGQTCEPIAERWARWLEHDPLRMIEREECQAGLRRLRGLYLDCGFRDQYHLHYGARAFARHLCELEIEHRYEEFDGSHSGIDHRLDISLPFLYAAVSGA